MKFDMRPAPSAPHLITLILLTAFATLSLNMFLPSLGNIAEAFKADYGLVSLAVGGYLAVTAVIQLIVGPLSDRVGRRPVLLAAIGVFTAASVGCAAAQNVWTFLFFRMLQGGMVAGYVLSLAIVRDTRSEQKAAGLIGYVSMAMALAPMLGPMIGGLLDTAFGWRANFVVYAAGGVLLLVLCWFDLGETLEREQQGKDGVKTGATTLLREPRFWGFALCTAFSTGAFYIFLAGAPLVAMTVFGVSSAELGVYIGSITAGFMAGSFFSARLAETLPMASLMLAGRLVACCGLTGGLVLLFAGYLTPLTYFGATVFVGIGNGITMPASNAGAMSVFPKLAGSAAGLSGAMTVAVGAVLTTLTGVMLTETNAAPMLIAIMLAASFVGLLAALRAQISANRQTRRV